MHRAKWLTMVAIIASVSACGGRQRLHQPAGTGPVPTARGASVPATSDQLMTANTQARPDRSAEPLLRSEKRRDDPFDLPPEQ